MPESNHLEKILSRKPSIQQPSLADQLTQITANVPKEPSFSEMLNRIMNRPPENNTYECLDQNKARAKSPPKNPNHALNRENVNTVHDHSSKIEMVGSKVMDLEDNQTSMKKRLDEIHDILKKHETVIAAKESQDSFSGLIAFFSWDIHWKSFALGVMALAAILAFIYMKL